MSEPISSLDSLPAGWTMEVRTRKTGHKDRYFTDPVSGYVFRSFKEVDRFLKTGKVGKLALKLKDKARDDKSTSEEKLGDSGKDGKIDGNQSSELIEGVKDEQISESVGTVVDCTSISGQAVDQCKEDPTIIEVNQSEAEGVEKTVEGNCKLPATTVFSAPVIITALPENDPSPQDKGLEKQETVKRCNLKREPEELAPRRASKRLAGIKLDPVPDIKTTRTRHIVSTAKAEAAGPGESSCKQTSSGERPTLNAETENKDAASLLIEINNKDATEMKPESPLKNLSLTDFWTNDPCIEFAVKTLTGDIPIVVGHENAAADVNKKNETPLVGSQLDDLSFGDLWTTDPCIEFAVKTLTGTFQSEECEELSIQDYFQQNIVNNSTLTSADVDTFCQTEILSQHFENPDKSTCTQNNVAGSEGGTTRDLGSVSG